MIALSSEQVRFLLHDLEVDDGTLVRSSYAWARRKYAPMHIHGPRLRSVREQIARALPDYTIAFDVVFEVANGTAVALHCDHESLGPFAYDRARAMRESHFLSVHFNLTPDGGSLVTLDWPRVSLAHHLVISRFGLFSLPHRMGNALTRPLVRRFARARSNEVGEGNVFDNLRLHEVSAGAPRTSYVVRLVRRGAGVRTSPALLAATTTPASHVLHAAMARYVRRSTEADRVPWSTLRARGRVEAAAGAAHVPGGASPK